MPFGPLVKAILFFKDHWREVWDAVVGVARIAADILKGVFNSVAQTIEGVWNSIADRVNSLPRINMPDILGGGDFGLPTLPTLKLPQFKYGGMVPGPAGAPILGLLHGGERVTPAGAAGGLVVNVANITASSEEGGRAAARGLIQELR